LTEPEHAPDSSIPINVWDTSGERSNGNGFTSFSAEWTVPDNPSKTGADIEIFPALEDPQRDVIIQPVLQWGQGGNYWSIESMVCGKIGSNCTRSTFEKVSPGDLIDGIISGSNCSSSGCSWTITTADITTGNPSVEVSWQARQPYPFAFVALESDISECSQLPPSDGVRVFTSLYDAAGVLVTGPWHEQPSGTGINCEFGTRSSSGSSAKLDWHS
jgi:hypothetical protein